MRRKGSICRAFEDDVVGGIWTMAYVDESKLGRMFQAAIERLLAQNVIVEEHLATMQCKESFLLVVARSWTATQLGSS